MTPTSLYPTTFGRTMDMACPNITASASIPPTPTEVSYSHYNRAMEEGTSNQWSKHIIRQRATRCINESITQCVCSPHPTMPSPLIMVVWESVPTTLSGYKRPSSLNTTLPRNSRFTWRVCGVCAWVCAWVYIPSPDALSPTLVARWACSQKHWPPISGTGIVLCFAETPIPGSSPEHRCYIKTDQSEYSIRHS